MNHFGNNAWQVSWKKKQTTIGHKVKSLYFTNVVLLPNNTQHWSSCKNALFPVLIIIPRPLRKTAMVSFKNPWHYNSIVGNMRHDIKILGSPRSTLVSCPTKWWCLLYTGFTVQQINDTEKILKAYGNIKRLSVFCKLSVRRSKYFLEFSLT